MPQTGGHSYWISKTNELIVNAAPGSSFATIVNTTPDVAFGRPTAFSRTGRSEPDPDTSRCAVDAMPDGERVIGLTDAGTDVASGSEILLVGEEADECAGWLEYFRDAQIKNDPELVQ